MNGHQKLWVMWLYSKSPQINHHYEAQYFGPQGIFKSLCFYVTNALYGSLIFIPLRHPSASRSLPRLPARVEPSAFRQVDGKNQKKVRIAYSQGKFPDGGSEYFIIQLAHFLPSKQLDFLLSTYMHIYLYLVHWLRWLAE